jgi:hypothetical protein
MIDTKKMFGRLHEGSTLTIHLHALFRVSSFVILIANTRISVGLAGRRKSSMVVESVEKEIGKKSMMEACPNLVTQKEPDVATLGNFTI